LILKLIGLVIFSYLLGSFPSAYVAGKVRSGIDIRRHGTGNVGATNVLLVVGPLFAVLVYIIDLLKGLVPVLLARNIIGTDLSMGLAGLAAILGHDFSIFLWFSGGKGVATTTGVIFGINPAIACIVILAWVVFVVITDNFIFSSLLSMFYVPLLMTSFKLSNIFVLFGGLYFLAGLFTHREDIVRIMNGQGNKALPAVRKYFGR
jgi:acyl phosphate:glycerol-3-phosphate acyltransferase